MQQTYSYEMERQKQNMFDLRKLTGRSEVFFVIAV